MLLRSMLFVPGDSDRKLAKARATSADALILDLEDSVAAERAEAARRTVRDCLDETRAAGRRQQLWVRINAVPHPASMADLVAVVPGQPDVILLPKTRDGGDVGLLDNYLTALEHRDGVAPGSIRIVPIATEAPESLLRFSTYVGCSPRLAGITWGAEDLAAELQAASNRLADGSYDDAFRLARSTCLIGARAAGVAAIDTVYPDFRDIDGLREEAVAARRSGFSGKMAIHPDQVDVINGAFTPTPDEIALARKIVAAFAGGAVGAVGIGGKMYDMPHLKQARALLALAEAAGVD